MTSAATLLNLAAREMERRARLYKPDVFKLAAYQIEAAAKREAYTDAAFYLRDLAKKASE